jgi:WD40 repeat protein
VCVCVCVCVCIHIYILTGEHLRRKKEIVYDGHERPVNAVALCNIDGKVRMVTASEDSYLRLWNVDYT